MGLRRGGQRLCPHPFLEHAKLAQQRHIASFIKFPQARIRRIDRFSISNHRHVILRQITLAWFSLLLAFDGEFEPEFNGLGPRVSTIV